MNKIKLFFLALSASFLIFLLINDNLSSKTGINYYFKGKRVLKKFYKNQRSHQVNKATDRLYKQQIDILGQNKTYKVKPFYIVKTKNFIQGKNLKKLLVIPKKSDFQIQVVPDKQVLWGPYTPNRRAEVLKIEAYHNIATEVYIDISPDEKFPLPLWAKSLDFWYLSGDPKIKISVYIEYPNGLESRYPVKVTDMNGWKKAYVNLYHGNQKQLYGSSPLYLKKIRIQCLPTGDIDNHLIVYTSFMNVYNYLKNETNLYKEPFANFADFENGMPKHWYYSANKKRIENTFTQIEDYQQIITEDNKKYLNFNLTKEVHQNKDFFIHFPAGLYRVNIEHKISLWIKGDSQGEAISLIFEEGKGRYFELEVTDIYFEGWKKFTIELPKAIYYYKNALSKEEYINLIGLKISTVNVDGDINIAFDRIESIIKKKKLGNLKDL